MKSWKTTLGGALSALGTALMGIGIVPQLSGTPNQVLLWVAISGFICNCMGTFFGHLFAVDQTALIAALTQQQKQNTASIAAGVASADPNYHSKI